MEKYSEGISVTKISKDQIDQEINSSAGLSCNGTVHEIPTQNATVQRIFLAPGEELPLKYKENLIKYADQVMAGLSKRDQKKMASYIKELKVEIKAKKKRKKS